MLAALLCAARLLLPPDSTVLLIRVLDVSDARIGGDAILITDSSARGARHVLIDAGEHGPTIAAWLEKFHVDTLAAVILSHAHVDHYGGLGTVFSRFPVRAFVYGGTSRTAVSYRALLSQIGRRHIPVVTPDTGVRLLTLVTGADSVELRILAPPRGCRTLPGAAGGGARHNLSLGGRLARGTFAMLFPGDAEQSELGWWMMTPPALLRAHVLQARHSRSDD